MDPVYSIYPIPVEAKKEMPGTELGVSTDAVRKLCEEWNSGSRMVKAMKKTFFFPEHGSEWENPN